MMKRSPWLVLSVLCAGFFMILMDTTIVNIAAPQVISGLDASLGQMLWIINAYTLTYAALLITGGRIGDLFGQKRLFLAGLSLFVLASAACGFAQTPAQLAGTRVLQGIGGALLTPQTLAILTVIFPANKRGAAFGIWGAVAGLATIAGPVFGGWLVTNFGWRSIFYVNVPIGLLTLIAAVVILPDLRLNQRHRLDFLGTLLASCGLVLICFGLIEGPSHSWGKVWGPVSIPLILLIGVAVLAGFAWQQRLFRHREPLIPAGIFTDRNFSVMSGVVAAISFGMVGLFLPLVIFLQSVLDLNAMQAGLILAPMSLASIASAPFAGRLADRDGGKDILILGLVMWAAGIGLVLWVTSPFTQRGALTAGLVVAGLGLGMTFAPLQSIAMRNIEPQVASAAAGMINTARQVGALLGSAAVGAMLQAQLAFRLPASARENVDALPQSFRKPFLEGFDKAAQGLQVGVGQTGSHLPADLPNSVRPAIEQVGMKTFHEAYIPSMRMTLLLPVIVLAIAVVAATFARRPAPD
jgi:EmrB/QacA subfamily drug resistance transporter